MMITMNFVHRKFCEEMFGGKNGEIMFEELKNNLERLEREQLVKMKWQMYNESEETPLIITIVTPLMERVHTMVSMDKTSNTWFMIDRS